METPNITLTPVDCKHINAIGHDAETNTLAIQFKNWKGEPVSIYHYANFPIDKFEEFKAAETKHKYFTANIKPEILKHPYTRISG